MSLPKYRFAETSVDAGDADLSDKGIIDELRRMAFGDDTSKFGPGVQTLLSTQVIQDLGLIIQRPSVGDAIVSEDKPLSSIFFIVQGTLAVGGGTSTNPAGGFDISRTSVKKSFTEVPKRLTVLGRRNFRRSAMVDEESQSRAVALPERRQLNPGDFIGIAEYATGTTRTPLIRVMSGPCCLLEIPTSNSRGVEWAMKIYAVTHEKGREKE